MKTYLQPGDSLDLVAPSGGVVPATPYKIGVCIAIAAVSAAAGETFAGSVVGCFTVPAATSQAWTQGALVYWDDTAKVFTTTASTNQKAGYAIAAKGASDTTGAVRLQPTL